MSFDAPEDNATWAEEENFPFELWSDDDRALALQYGAAATASQSIADRITVVLGRDGEWLLVYDPVNVSTGPADTLADCEALFGGQ